jgi:hypothetical protein
MTSKSHHTTALVQPAISLGVMLCFMLPLHAAENELTLEEVLEALAAQEGRLQNLKVSAEVWEEEERASGWERTETYISLTAWFLGAPSTRMRVDVHEEVLPWFGPDAAAPYSPRQAYSLSWDGKEGRTLERGVEDADKNMVEIRLGQIENGPPGRLRGPMMDFASGGAFSSFLYDNHQQESLSQHIWAIAETVRRVDDEAITVTRVKFEDSDAIQIAFGNQYMWWLDPERGHSLLAYRFMVDGGRQVLAERRVLRLKQVAPGIWYPMEAYYLGAPPPENSGRNRIRYHYMASDVIANNNDFDTSVFRLRFPPGTNVRDEIENKSYQVAPERSPT